MLRRSRLILRTLAIAALLGCTIVLVLYCTDDDPFERRKFSASDWTAATPEVRQGMARDLVEHYIKPGMPMSRVEALLGSGTVDVRGLDPRRHPLPGMGIETYYLGDPSTARMDSAFVWVHFDGSGRVMFAEIMGY